MKYPHLEPNAKKAIDTCKKKKLIFVTCVDGFKTKQEALILQDLLWYARDNSVEVVFVPKIKNEN